MHRLRTLSRSVHIVPQTMGKNGGPMTAKAISKKLKAKGLGRLRWYCQMCEKQCRDENGFQCHISSESHKRLLTVFSESKNEYLTGFSEKFRKDFLSVVRQRYGTTFVLANAAYQEYIKDKHHIHMNATRWTTLTGFVNDLGRSKHCIVEVRETGHWIKIVDRQAAKRAAEAREMDRKRAEELHRADLRLQAQMRAASAIAAVEPADDRGDEVEVPLSEPMALKMRALPQMRRGKTVDAPSVFASAAVEDDGDSDVEDETTKKPKRKTRWGIAKVSVLEEIMRTQRSISAQKSYVGEKRSAAAIPQPKDKRKELEEEEEEEDCGWVMKGIEVRVMNESIGGGKFFEKKGRVMEVVQEFGAMVRLFDDRVVLQLDQDDLQTVVPGTGGGVVILRGQYRGRRGTVVNWQDASDSVSVRLEATGETLSGVSCKHVSRAA